MRSIPRSRRTSSRPGFPAFVGDLCLQPAILIAEPAFPERGGGLLHVRIYGDICACRCMVAVEVAIVGQRHRHSQRRRRLPMEFFRQGPIKRHVCIGNLKAAIGNRGIAIGKEAMGIGNVPSPWAIVGTLRAIEMMPRINRFCHEQARRSYTKPSVRWPSHLWFMETLRNMLQNRKRPGAWSVDRPGTRAYHSELRVLWADADAP